MKAQVHTAEHLPKRGQLALLTREAPINIKPVEEFTPAPFRVILPFFNGDVDRALNLCQWMHELSPKGFSNEAYLVTDTNVPVDTTRKVYNLFRKTFPKAQIHLLTPLPRKFAWPAGNNHTFCGTVDLMGELDKETPKPFLWLETDVAPTKPDWLTLLEAEYNLAKRGFMGYWVDGYDIMNGMGVYPPNLKKWLPRTFSRKPEESLPWDCNMANEMIQNMHPANHLMPNIWLTRKNGRPGLVHGSVPVWTKELLDWCITPHTCIIHRCKTGKLIDLLREKLTPSPL